VTEVVLKIPFAVRDKKIVCIADLGDDERGLKCNCKCIVCKSPLIAKLGEKRSIILLTLKSYVMRDRRIYKECIF